jgi:hypothetical protein
LSQYRDFLAEIDGVLARQLFFVCGAMRSGTTWLQVQLDAHPAVRCAGEGHFADKLVRLLQGALNDYNGYLTWKNADAFGEISGFPVFGIDEFRHLAATAILTLLAGLSRTKPAATALGEKTPDTINYLPLFDDLFPAAKFVHIVRDGRDAAVSAWYHSLRVSPDWLGQTYASMESYVAQCAKEWADEMTRWAAFAELRPERSLAVRYEDLLSAPAETLAGVFRFLGVDAAPAIVEACCARGSFASLSGGRKAGEEDRGSFFRKGVAGDWRTQLDDASQRLFLDQAGDWLRRYGYA